MPQRVKCIRVQGHGVQGSLGSTGGRTYKVDRGKIQSERPLKPCPKESGLASIALWGCEALGCGGINDRGWGSPSHAQPCVQNHLAHPRPPGFQLYIDTL